MSIIFFVAGHTLQWRLSPLLAVHMATVTARKLVAVGQQEIGGTVIKAIQIHGRDIGLPPQMIAMTGLATLISIVTPAMKTARAVDVSRNVLMTVQAQSILGSFGK
jgi:hypothetical protein